MSKHDAALRKCTKDDLIWIIDYLARHCLYDEAISRALIDLKYDKEMRKHDMSQEILHKKAELLRKYSEVMKPYNGLSLSEIPEDIFIETGRYLDEIKQLSDKWYKLMGIKEE